MTQTSGIEIAMGKTKPPPVEPTPEPTLEHLEGAICEALLKRTSMQSAFERRMSTEERDAVLTALANSLGPRYAGASLSNFEIYADEQKPVLDRLRKFAERMPEAICGGGLLLFGRPGTGKDHLLAALLKIAVVKHRLRVLWHDGQELFEEARYAIKREKEHDFRTKLVVPHILAISDPQPPRGDLTEYQVGLIRDVIDRRYRRGLSTWLTTNIDNTEDANRLLTEPLLQRLKEAACQVFCDWPSYRERRKAAI